jgi:hypothetical protein
MTAVSPRNPNLCLSCEQLVEDDSAELERLFAAEAPAEIAARPVADSGSTDGPVQIGRRFFVTPA